MTQSSRYAGFRISLALLVCLATSNPVTATDLISVPPESELIEILRSASPAEKAIACKHLAVYGDKSAVPELAKLLSNEQLASWSRIALEAIPDPAADAALVDAAKQLKGRLLVGTINSIGVRRSAGAVEVLTARLKDADSQAASAAAVALGRIGNDAATKILRPSLTSADPAVRSAVAEGCILCAEQLVSSGKLDAASEIYDEVRRADVPLQRILEATRGAILARGEQGIPLLIEQLKSDDKKLFRLGLTIARELPGRRVIEALAAELENVPPERAYLIVTAIGDRGDARITPAVLGAAIVGDRQVRLAAIEVIGKLGDAASVPALLEIAASSDADSSRAAKTALARLPGENVDAKLASSLSMAEGDSLPVLIEIVGARRIEAASPSLVKALRHSDKEVRATALAALGATAGPDHLAVLISQVVDSTDGSHTEVAGRALQEASVRMPDREATAEQLAKAMSHGSTATKVRLIQILGAMGGTNALESIAAAAQSDDQQLQDVGTRVLGEWMTADAAPRLYGIASTDHPYKTRALRGYLRIARQLDIPASQRLDMCRKALAIAERSAERSLALDAMKRCPSAESVELATSLVDDAELRDRAVETAIFIGEKIKDTDPEAAATAGQKVLQVAPPSELAERARALTKISKGTN
jgi:HEAT repeat protein